MRKIGGRRKENGANKSQRKEIWHFREMPHFGIFSVISPVAPRTPLMPHIRLRFIRHQFPSHVFASHHLRSCSALPCSCFEPSALSVRRRSSPACPETPGVQSPMPLLHSVTFGIGCLRLRSRKASVPLTLHFGFSLPRSLATPPSDKKI